MDHPQGTALVEAEKPGSQGGQEGRFGGGMGQVQGIAKQGCCHIEESKKLLLSCPVWEIDLIEGFLGLLQFHHPGIHPRPT